MEIVHFSHLFSSFYVVFHLFSSFFRRFLSSIFIFFRNLHSTCVRSKVKQIHSSLSPYVPDQHTLLGFWCASSLNQQSVGSRVASLGHIIQRHSVINHCDRRVTLLIVIHFVLIYFFRLFNFLCILSYSK